MRYSVSGSQRITDRAHMDRWYADASVIRPVVNVTELQNPAGIAGRLRAQLLGAAWRHHCAACTFGVRPTREMVACSPGGSLYHSGAQAERTDTSGIRAVKRLIASDHPSGASQHQAPDLARPGLGRPRVSLGAAGLASVPRWFARLRCTVLSPLVSLKVLYCREGRAFCSETSGRFS